MFAVLNWKVGAEVVIGAGAMLDTGAGTPGMLDGTLEKVDWPKLKVLAGGAVVVGTLTGG